MTLFGVNGGNASGVLLLLGAALGSAMGMLLLRRQKEPPLRSAWGTALFVLLCVPLCLYGAHALYCLLDFLYLYRLWENPALMLDLSYGGFALYGGMLGFLLAGAITARAAGWRFLSLMDAFAPAGLVMIAFVRLYEGSMGQGFSLDVENPAFCFFPLSVFDPEWEVWHLALFVPEAAYALLAALLLSRKRLRGRGERLSAALLLYSGMQIWFESLRRDSYMRCYQGFVRTMQLISALVVTGLLLCALCRLAWGAGRKAAALAAHLLCVAGVVTFEFAVEYKVPGLEWISRSLATEAGHYAFCYGGMLLMVLLMMCVSFLVWRAYWRERPHAGPSNARIP